MNERHYPGSDIRASSPAATMADTQSAVPHNAELMEKERPAQIPEALERLHGNINHFTELFSNLNGRLNPVCVSTPTPPTDTTAKDDQPVCEVAMVIHAAADKVYDLIYRCESLLGSLEV